MPSGDGTQAQIGPGIVKRVAIATCIGTIFPSWECACADTLSSRCADRAKISILAVLNEIREPSEAMICSVRTEEVAEHWRSMIDALRREISE